MISYQQKLYLFNFGLIYTFKDVYAWWHDLLICLHFLILNYIIILIFIYTIIINMGYKLS